MNYRSLTNDSLNTIDPEQQPAADGWAGRDKAKRLGRVAVKELVSVCRSTGKHLLLVFHCLKHCGQLRSKEQEIYRMTIELGERACQSDQGDESIRRKIAVIDDRLASIRQGKGSPRQLEAERRGLVARLANGLQDVPSLQHSIDSFKEAQESQTDLHWELQQHRERLRPGSRRAMLRIAAGYTVLLAASFGFSLLLFSDNAVSENTQQYTTIAAAEFTSKQQAPDVRTAKLPSPPNEPSLPTTRPQIPTQVAPVSTDSPTVPAEQSEPSAEPRSMPAKAPSRPTVASHAFDSSGYSRPDMFRRIYEKSLDETTYDDADLAGYLQAFLEPFFQTKNLRAPVSPSAYAKVKQHLTTKALGQVLGGFARSRHRSNGVNFAPTTDVTTTLVDNLRNGRADAQLFYDRHGCDTPAARKFFANVEHYIDRLDRPSIEAEMRKGN